MHTSKRKTNIFINTWTPTARDLSEYPHIVLTLPYKWNPSKVQFLRATEGNMEVIETMVVKNTKINHVRENEVDSLEYHNPYFGPIKTFNIQAFNARIMQSIIVPTQIVKGPLS